MLHAPCTIDRLVIASIAASIPAVVWLLSVFAFRLGLAYVLAVTACWLNQLPVRRLLINNTMYEKPTRGIGLWRTAAICAVACLYLLYRETINLRRQGNHVFNSSSPSRPELTLHYLTVGRSRLGAHAIYVYYTTLSPSASVSACVTIENVEKSGKYVW